MQGLDQDVATQILADALIRAQARILKTNVDKPFSVQRHDFDLSVARIPEQPFQIGYPFRSLFVVAATDNDTKISFRPITIDSFQSAIPMGLNSGYSLDYPINKGFVHWDAQPGKTLSIIVLVDAVYESGSLISQLQGGIAIQEGSSVSTSVVTLVAATAAVLCPALGARKVATIQNNTGASIWVGPTGVTNTGATTGIEILNGQSLEWRNTAELRGYSVAGGDLVVMEES